MTLRRRVHSFLDGPDPSPLAWLARSSIAALIVANVAAVALETLPSLRPHAAWFHRFEVLSLAVFGTEYLLRLWCAPEQPNAHGRWPRLRWMLTPAALIDLLAIVPGLLLHSGVDLRVLRRNKIVRDPRPPATFLPALPAKAWCPRCSWPRALHPRRARRSPAPCEPVETRRRPGVPPIATCYLSNGPSGGLRRRSRVVATVERRSSAA